MRISTPSVCLVLLGLNVTALPTGEAAGSRLSMTTSTPVVQPANAASAAKAPTSSAVTGTNPGAQGFFGVAQWFKQVCWCPEDAGWDHWVAERRELHTALCKMAREPRRPEVCSMFRRSSLEKRYYEYIEKPPPCLDKSAEPYKCYSGVIQRPDPTWGDWVPEPGK